MVNPVKKNPYGWSIIIASVIVLGYADIKSMAGQERTIHFPKDRSIGEVYVRNHNSSIEGFDALIDWEWLGQAKDNVLIPPNKAVMLNITKQAWQDGKPFEGLKPDDIQMLSFTQYQDANDSALEEIPHLADLEALELSGTQILGPGLKHLTKLSKLKWLGLAVRYIGDDEIAPLADLTALESINVRNTRLSNYGMAHISKIKTLRHLDICGTSVDDNGLKHIKDLTSLRRLHFFRTNITDDGMKYLAGLTDMERLYLQYTQISNVGLVHLKNMKNLKILNLTGTKIGDAGLIHLKDFKSLEELELPPDTEITDEGIAHLLGLDSLKRLYLISNAITAEGLDTLAQLKSLEEFDTGGTNIDDESITKIADFPALRSLWIQSC